MQRGQTPVSDDLLTVIDGTRRPDTRRRREGLHAVGGGPQEPLDRGSGSEANPQITAAHDLTGLVDPIGGGETRTVPEAPQIPHALVRRPQKRAEKDAVAFHTPR